MCRARHREILHACHYWEYHEPQSAGRLQLSRGKIWSFDFHFAAGKVALRWIGDLHPDAGITPNAVFLLLPTPANIRATDGVGFDHLR